MSNNRNKLQTILAYEHGQPLFYSYLIKNGFSRQLLQKYCQNNWLERIVSEVYKHKNQQLNPLLIIKAMQIQEFSKSQDFILGGQSALYLQGIKHYVKDIPVYHIFKTKKNRTPHLKWLKNQGIFNIVSTPVFKAKKNLMASFTVLNGLTVSSLERALLEMAYLIPNKANYDEFLKLMELCPSLRSNLLQTLLENCLSIKAKRLFLYTASVVNHSWYKKLNEAKINLGTGTLQVVAGGKYIKKYSICVPEINNDNY